MKASEIMNDHTGWHTLDRAAWDCYDAICPVTDYADLRESEVLFENTFDEWGIMEEAIK